jgi:putative transposase
MTGHLGYVKGDPAGRGSGNSRNGSTGKTVATEVGDVALAVPRDRAGTFEPRLVPKGTRRAGGLDDRRCLIGSRMSHSLMTRCS